MQPSTAIPRKPLFRRIQLTLEMIKFEHSVFAMPFAMTGAMLAWRASGYPSEGMWQKVAWIVVAMIGARSAAMAFNRVLDAAIDGRNPRTQARHLPAGVLSPAFAWGFIVVSSLVFLAAAWQLGRLCLQLAPIALAVVFVYSWTKRFTSLSHVVLGFSLGIAPAAAWIAVRGQLDAEILWLTAAVTLWTAGFDIIYSCQDYEFDRREGLFSIPCRFGVGGGLWIARILHVGMVICLFVLAGVLKLGWLAFLGIGAVVLLLMWEHRLVRSGDLSRVDAAFFTMNGYISMLFFLFWAADILVFRNAT